MNPSTSDVVATTSAEALAMGKWVICPRHPSNAWFQGNFRNALIYESPADFSEKLQYAEVSDLTAASPARHTIDCCLPSRFPGLPGHCLTACMRQKGLFISPRIIQAQCHQLPRSLTPVTEMQDHDPQALTEEEATKLTWEDATQRFLDAAEIGCNEWPGRLTSFRDGLTWPVINAGTVSCPRPMRFTKHCLQPSLKIGHSLTKSFAIEERSTKDA